MWKKTVAVLLASAIVAGLSVATAGLAAAEPTGTEQTEPVPPRDSADTAGLIAIGDLQLLSNLNVCPDVTVLLPIGNVLGILGSGTATATATDAPITCAAVSTARQVGDRSGG